MTNWSVVAARIQFSTGARLRCYKKIAVMLGNKLGIDQILDELYNRESENGTKPNEAMAILYDEWRGVIRNGGQLADAIEGWVPPSEKMIIMAGENSGDLPRALRSVISVVNTSKGIRGAVIGGVAYPLVLNMGTLAYLYIFGVHVIPGFVRIMDPTRWGPLAYSLYQLSTFVTKYGVIGLAGIGLFLTIVVLSFSRLTGRLRFYLDKLPPWSLYRLVVGTGFLFALSAMLSGGGRVKVALQAIRDHANPYLTERIDAFLLGVNSGLNPGDAISESGFDFPSKELVNDLGIYAKYSADFSQALDTVAKEWMEEGLAEIKALMEVAKGAAILLLAMVLMWIAAGFFAIQQEITASARVFGG